MGEIKRYKAEIIGSLRPPKHQQRPKRPAPRGLKMAKPRVGPFRINLGG